MDKTKLIAALVEKHGIKLDKDDPAFLLVDLNLLVLENALAESTRRLTETTNKFSEVATRNVDDFIVIANEALTKFIHRTNELKAALDVLTPAVPLPVVVTPTAAIQTPIQKTKEEEPKPKNFLILGGFVVFAFGFLVGAGLSFLF